MWCSLQCKVSNTLQNWDLHRLYSARLDKRIQGFTEDCGNATGNGFDSSDENDDTKHHQPNQDTLHSNQHFPECNVRLLQYRPAWFEQLALRVCKVSHVVINSPYMVTEATGPLPYLQDFDGGSPSRNSNNSPPPAMIGRHQTNIGGDEVQNSILEYLKLHRGVDLDVSLTNEDDIRHSVTFLTIIRDTLNPCLMSLRYNADPVAWDQIYRPQCISATSGSSSNHYWQGRPILAMWQAWSEKVHSISKLSSLQRIKSKTAIIETARQTYAIFEHRMKAQHSLSKSYLLGTAVPTIVDCLLWDHLMQALTDVHLVIVLADFPSLLQFTQFIWETFYFGTVIEELDKQTSSVWVWNMEENALNAFTGIPLIPLTKQANNDDMYRNGVDMMSKLNLLQKDLSKSLSLAKQQRSSTSYPLQRYQTFATWHRWRMGDGLLPKMETTNYATSGSSEEISRRQYQRNDEIWMISVVATTVVSMLGFGLVG